MTGKPEGEGCNGETQGEKNEKCAYSFQDGEQKSRWLFLTLDGPVSNGPLKGHLWEGKSELFGKLFLCVALLLRRGKTKRKNSVSFPTEELQFGSMKLRKGRRWERS